MAAQESEAMVRARKLVKAGKHTAYAAAQVAGITPSAIYMAPWYREWRDAQKRVARRGARA